MNKQTRAGEYLAKRGTSFDLALLQETRDPRLWAPPDWVSVTWRPMWGTAGSRKVLWGSAIVAPALELEPHEPDAAFPWLAELGGACVIARQLDEPRWLASVHFGSSQLPDEVLSRHPWDHIPISTPNGSVWETDVIPFELHGLFSGDTFLWGGDLNSAEVMDDLGFVGGNRELRRRWRDAGSHDLRLRFHAEEQQTFFRPKRRPYQLDHVFADAATERRVASWEVDRSPISTAPPRSDHAPIVVTLR